MIYRDPPEFATILAALPLLEEEINNLAGSAERRVTPQWYRRRTSSLLTSGCARKSLADLVN